MTVLSFIPKQVPEYIPLATLEQRQKPLSLEGTPDIIKIEKCVSEKPGRRDAHRREEAMLQENQKK